MGFAQRVHQLARVVKPSFSCEQVFLFAVAQLGVVDLFHLGLKLAEALQALLFAAVEFGDLPPQCEQLLVAGAVVGEQLAGAAEAVEEVDVAVFVHQALAVVLAVDVEEVGAELAEDGGGDGLHVDAADGFAVGGQLALDVEGVVLVAAEPEFVELPAQLGGEAGKDGADEAFFGAAANEFAAGALAHDGADGVDDDGLTGAGFAGEDGQAVAELDVGLFNHCDIFDMKKL